MAAIVAWSVRKEYVPSVELLTRVSEGSDFATDVCIRKAGEDPETGQRYLEEISFEVINEQSLRDIREKAEELVARGIRRFFAIFVKRGKVAEWSRERRDFVALDGDFEIDDPCFEKPISVRALLDKAEAERELVSVLEEKKSPGIEAIKEKSLARGERRGMRKGREKGVEEGIEVGILKGREEGLGEGLEKGIQAGLELGRVQGREEGLEKGLEKGRELGREEGLAKGREEGLAKGREEGLRLLGLLVEGRLGRPLSEAEQKTMAERAQREGMERVAALSGEGLRTWLLEGGAKRRPDRRSFRRFFTGQGHKRLREQQKRPRRPYKSWQDRSNRHPPLSRHLQPLSLSRPHASRRTKPISFCHPPVCD